ncbi:hypothetical protein BGX26_001516 [Mortierella sp. AD094]|nr:hypothetical protein BGX26_001516 [Mortierella sp. AD094]
MASVVGSKKEEFERISRHHKAFTAGTWNTAGLDLEIRSCLLLNRFTRNLAVMYASPSCQSTLEIDPDDLLGKPLLLFIRADDLASFVEQGDLVKSSAAVKHMRFWFQSPNCRQEIPCEAMLYGTSDALVMILRKCLPFRRKQFITDSSYSDCFPGTALSSGSFSGVNSQKFPGKQNNGFGRSGSYNHHRNLYSIRGEGSQSRLSPSILSTCPSDFVASSVSSTSKSSGDLRGTRYYQAPLRSIHVGSINSIRNLDREQHLLRPLTSVQGIDSDATDSTATPAITYQLRELHTQDSEVEELDLADGIEKVSPHASHRRDIDEDEVDYSDVDIFEGSYDNDVGGVMVNEEMEEIQMPSSMRRHWREG